MSQYVLTGETTGSNSLSDDVTLPKRADGFPSVSCVAIMYKNVRRFWRLRYNSSFVSAENGRFWLSGLRVLRWGWAYLEHLRTMLGKGSA